MENLVLLNGIEYTGSSQLAITPGGVSGELLGIDAVREFNVLTDTYGAEYGKRAGAQVTVVTQSGTNAAAWTAVRISPQQRARRPQLFRLRLRPSALPSKPVRRRAGRAAQEEPPVPFRQLRRLPAGRDPQQRQRGSRRASAPGNVPQCLRQLRAGGQSEPGHAAIFRFLAAAQRAELRVNGLPSGTAFAYNNPKQDIREDFGTLRAGLRPPRPRLLLCRLHHRQRRQPGPRWPTRCSRPPPRSACRSAACRKRTSSRPICSMPPAPAFRARRSIWIRRCSRHFPPACPSSTGAGPGGIVVSGGVTTTGLSGITSAGPNNAAGVWNRRNLFTYADDVQIAKGIHQISAGVWFQRVQDNEDTASRQLGQATFHQPDHVSARDRQQLPGRPERQRVGMAKPLRRLVLRGCHQAAPQSHRPRRHPPRVHHRLERGVRTGRQLHRRCERRARNRSARGHFGLHAEQRDHG